MAKFGNASSRLREDAGTVAVSKRQRLLIERVADLLPRTEFRKMVSGEDQEAVFRLRYEAYRREDRIPENENGLSVDFADELPNTSTYGIFINGKLCSSIRLSILTAACPVSPSTVVFGDTLKNMVVPGKVFVDPTRFVTDHKAARDYPELPFLTLKVPSMAGLYYDADLVLSTIRTNHIAFYQRVFHAGPIGEAIFYPPMNMEVRLLSFMPREHRSDILRRYPFFNLNYFEGRQLFGPIDDVPGLAELNKSAIWKNIGPVEINDI